MGLALRALALTGYNHGTLSEQSVRVERNGSEVTLHILLSAEALQERESQFLAEINRQLKVPGFRPGNAPEHLLLRYYGEEAFVRELKDDLIRKRVAQAIRDLGLHPLTAPRVEVVDFARGQRLAFQARFAVLPEINVPDDIAVTVPDPPPVQVTEEQLTTVLAELRREAAVLEPKTDPAEEGNVVHLRRGNRTWEVEVTRSGPTGKQLMGVKVGDRVTLVSDAGRAETFRVDGVYRVLLPSLEEAAIHYGHSSWEAFREKVRGELLRQGEEEQKEKRRTAALDALADALRVEVPSSLLAEAVENEMKEKRIRPDLRPEVEAALRRRLRREILAQGLAEQKGLRPDEEEVRRLAQELDIEEGAVRQRLVFERAAEWIIERARRET